VGRKTEDRGQKTENGETEARPRIGIPMALASWQLLPTFSQFFRELGFEVVLSGRTSKETIRKGVESVTAQPCFPIKVAYGHIVELIEKGVDYIFLPSIVSTIASFPENKHNHFCPYIQSFPYQVRSAFGDKLGKTKLLIAPLRLGEGDKLAKKTFVELGKRLNVSPSEARRAMEKGFEAQCGFEKSLTDKGREILASIREDEKLFILVSRPYNGCDDGVSLQLPKKFADAGVEMMPMDMLDFSQAQLGDKSLHSEIYWSYGQKILRAAEIIRQDNRLFAVYLSNFSCGPDSFLMPFFKDIMGSKPCLQLEIDEHSADAGVITRLEAFLESLKNYKPEDRRRKTEDGRQKTEDGRQRTEDGERRSEDRGQRTAVGKRTLYIPYMSDASFGLAGCLRAYGQAAEVMPIADEAVLTRGRAYTTGKECLPCAITNGEMLNVLSRDGVKPENAAFFMPGASGPCRFGLYHCMGRLILKQAGVDEANIVSPNQDSNFYSQLVSDFDGTGLGTFMKDIWTAVVGIDLLHKLVLRVRPYAIEPKQAQEVYEKCLRQWVEAVERRTDDRGQKTDKVRLFEQFAEEFAKVKLDKSARNPRIGIVGEIYVRNHPFANLNIIRRLEELGAACDLAPLAEWVYYTNFTRSKMAKRRGQIKNLFSNTIQNFFQHRIERALAQPMEKKFGKLAEHPIRHVIDLAKPYIDESFEGEAILSIGKIVEYHQDGLGGVVNVMPFTCMPSTIVNTQTRRLSADCNEMPILNLSFDGQEDPTLTTRLEAFVEQVGARSKVGVAELVAT
ncbi:MAG TPA: acyl-CoA dehydratase activase-related protein, partial [Sedimentisphaerales bacterium]